MSSPNVSCGAATQPTMVSVTITAKPIPAAEAAAIPPVE